MAHAAAQRSEADDHLPELTSEQKLSLAAELGWELQKCARLQQREELKDLLKYGGAYCGAPEIFPDVNWRDETGASALWWTCLHGDGELAHILLDAGADPNGTDKDEWTAVSIAARCGHDNCILMLIQAGANLSIPVSDGDTALDKAIFWEHEDSAGMLREHGGAAPFYCPSANYRARARTPPEARRLWVNPRRATARSFHRVPASPPLPTAIALKVVVVVPERY